MKCKYCRHEQVTKTDIQETYSNIDIPTYTEAKEYQNKSSIQDRIDHWPTKYKVIAKKVNISSLGDGFWWNWV